MFVFGHGPAIAEIADEHRLVVLEDAAHAIGAHYKDWMIGTLSPATAFSFYATKNLSCGEGGLLVTDDDQIADRARSLSMHGISRDAWKRHSVTGSPHWRLYEPGYKYNMPDIAASIGLHQLPRLEGFIATNDRDFGIEHTFFLRLTFEIDDIVLTEGQALGWFSEHDAATTDLAYADNDILAEFFAGLPDSATSTR